LGQIAGAQGAFAPGFVCACGAAEARLSIAAGSSITGASFRKDADLCGMRQEKYRERGQYLKPVERRFFVSMGEKRSV
jgi:hypothetical protein